MMENSDEAVERVLSGLRDVEAPAGIERRILEATRNVVPERRHWTLATPWRPASVASWAIAVAAVMVVSSMLCWTALRAHRHGSGNGAPRHQVISASSEISREISPEIDPEVERTPSRAQQLLTKRPALQATVKTARRAKFVRVQRSAPLHDVGADNHPAPEAPLTEQEKLLLLLARRTDPVEIAVLNPSLWAARDAEEKAGVKKFFEPSTTGDDK